MDSLDAERAPAGLTRGEEVTASPVPDPASLWARQAPFGGDQHARAVSAPRRESLRDEPFIVADLAGVQAVRVGRVEEGDAAVECGMQDSDRARLVPIALGGKAHAAHSNHWRAVNQSASGASIQAWLSVYCRPAAGDCASSMMSAGRGTAFG